MTGSDLPRAPVRRFAPHAAELRPRSLRGRPRARREVEPDTPGPRRRPGSRRRLRATGPRPAPRGRGALALVSAVARVVVPAAAFGLVMPAVFDCTGWFGIAVASVGPLTELLGPRLRSGLGRARSLRPGEAVRTGGGLPAEFVELVRARELLAALSRHQSDRLLLLARRIDMLEVPSRTRRDDLLVGADLVYEGLCAWHDLQRAQTRFCRAHAVLAERIADAGPERLADVAVARLRPAIAELLRFFDRVELNQRRRLQRLLQHATALEQHAARGGASLVPALREALAELAAANAPSPPAGFPA